MENELLREDVQCDLNPELENSFISMFLLVRKHHFIPQYCNILVSLILSDVF